MGIRFGGCLDLRLARGALAKRLSGFRSGPLLLISALAGWAAYWDLLFDELHYLSHDYRNVAWWLLWPPALIAPWWLIRGRSRLGIRIGAFILLVTLYALALDPHHELQLPDMMPALQWVTLAAVGLVLPSALVFTGFCWWFSKIRKPSGANTDAAPRSNWQLYLADLGFIMVATAIAVSQLIASPTVTAVGEKMMAGEKVDAITDLGQD